MSQLHHAVLMYGSRGIPVASTETTPLPTTFDFDDPAGCARKILAVMSNASGGHTLRDCRVIYHLGRQTAAIISSGSANHYGPVERQTLTVDQAIKIEREQVRITLGSVRTDQYGDGWRRARWAD